MNESRSHEHARTRARARADRTHPPESIARDRIHARATESTRARAPLAPTGRPDRPIAVQIRICEINTKTTHTHRLTYTHTTTHPPIPIHTPPTHPSPITTHTHTTINTKRRAPPAPKIRGASAGEIRFRVTTGRCVPSRPASGSRPSVAAPRRMRGADGSSWRARVRACVSV